MTQPEPWHRKTAVIIVALIFLAPVGIALLWMSGKFSKNTRVWLTVGSALLFVAALARNEKQDETGPQPSAKQDPVEGSQPRIAPVDCESVGLMTRSERIDPETGASIPRCGIRFEVVHVERKDLPGVMGVSRTLLIEPGRTREEIGELLQWHYEQIRAELASTDRPNKQIFVYAYDDRRRAAAGRGEFLGMVQEVAINGSKLGTQGTLTFKLPPEGAEKPTAREDEIYDELMDELFREDVDPQAEERVMKRIARRYKLTVEQLETLHLKVQMYRNP